MKRSKTAPRRRGAPVTARRRVPMGIRVTPEMRDELVKRAATTGRSITQEMETLLGQGLLTEELLSGALRRSNMTMVATFKHAGTAAARGVLKDSEPATWLADPLCYRVALAQVVMAMLEAGPDGLSLEAARTLHQWIEDRLRSREASGFIEPPEPKKDDDA